MLNKEMIKTSSELEPSSIASSLNWFLLSALSSLSELLIFVWALLLQRILYVRPSSAEVGSTQSQAVYCLFVNSSKRICAMFIKYFHSFLLEFFLYNICCVSKHISHLLLSSFSVRDAARYQSYSFLNIKRGRGQSYKFVKAFVATKVFVLFT